MPRFVHDFVDQLAAELASSRRELEGVLERTDALAALHARALDLAAELKRPLTAEDLFGRVSSEKERAQLQLLVARATAWGGNPAFEVGRGAGGRLESGAGL